MMKELVILSGKGGTGKTSLTSSFACLAENIVLADCDVDAADLHLVFSPEINYTESFTSGYEAKIRTDECSGCDLCREYCQFDSIKHDAEDNTYAVEPALCEGCGVCVSFCPEQCIDFPERVCGEWYRSFTRIGPMVHARLGIGAENSGKLVSRVREEAKKLANQQQADLVLIDGPPGIGCPVIASITGADYLVLVTEPSLSGLHDIERVLKLADHFGLTSGICVNKWDVNPQLTNQIEQLAEKHHVVLLGNVRYDSVVTQAQIAVKSVVEMGDSGIAQDIKAVWHNIQTQLINR